MAASNMKTIRSFGMKLNPRALPLAVIGLVALASLARASVVDNTGVAVTASFVGAVFNYSQGFKTGGTGGTLGSLVVRVDPSYPGSSSTPVYLYNAASTGTNQPTSLIGQIGTIPANVTGLVSVNLTANPTLAANSYYQIVVGNAATGLGWDYNNISNNAGYGTITYAYEININNNPANTYCWYGAYAEMNLGLAPTKLVITSVNGGANPTTGSGLSVVVQAQDAGGNPEIVVSNTAVSLTINTGSGTLGGTLSGTMTAGTSSVTISGVTYSKPESGVSLTASGGSMTAGNSSAFMVIKGASLVQKATASSGSGTSATATLSSAANASNLLVVAVWYQSASAVNPTITDNSSGGANTYTSIGLYD